MTHTSNLKKSLYWEKQPVGIKCLLCPNYCLIKDSERGICRKRVNFKDVLYSENYAETISLNIDPLEKKPLYHFYPAEYVLSLGANSCNLTCKFCQNHSSSQIDCVTQKISPQDLIGVCHQKSIKHVAFTYTEPFTWFEYIFDAAKLLYERNISVILVTNGYVNLEPLTDLLPFISAMNIDIKAFSDKFYSDICGGKIEPVLETIKFANTRTHIELTLLLIETLNDDENELHSLFSFVSSINKKMPLHISKYFPRYNLKINETSENKLLNAAQIAKKYLNYVYIGNMKSDFNNTYCPKCDILLIERTSFKTNMLNLKKGSCARCGFEVL